MAKVNDEAKMKLLAEAFGAGENYLATAYANTLPGVNIFSMFGALGYLIGEIVDKDGFKTRHNAYLGVTATGVNVVILDGLNNSKIKNAIRFSFAELSDIKAIDNESSKITCSACTFSSTKLFKSPKIQRK